MRLEEQLDGETLVSSAGAPAVKLKVGAKGSTAIEGTMDVPVYTAAWFALVNHCDNVALLSLPHGGRGVEFQVVLSVLPLLLPYLIGILPTSTPFALDCNVRTVSHLVDPVPDGAVW